MAGFGSLVPAGLDVGEPLVPDGGQFSPGTGLGNKIADIAAKLGFGALQGMGTLPQRAIQNSQFAMDTGTYDPATSVEAAMLPMGTGAIAGVPVRAGEQVLGAGGIRAYHGSPHDFDRFDLSKIGTGEGAQAYGHGLYFAENEGVARSYRDALSSNQIPIDKLAEYYKPGQVLRTDYGYDLVKKFDPENRAVTVRSVDKDGRPTQDLLGLRDRTHMTPPSLNLLNAEFKARGLPEHKPGSMYEVNINADPAKFLDWDKPLGPDLHALIKDAASTIRPNVYERMMGIGRDLNKYGLTENLEGKTGESVVGQLRRGLGSDSLASEALRERGIPGIKYLDQGSRGAGNGSSNYVVFDDKLIDIMRKYGLAGLPAAGAGAASFGSLAPRNDGL